MLRFDLTIYTSGLQMIGDKLAQYTLFRHCITQMIPKTLNKSKCNTVCVQI